LHIELGFDKISNRFPKKLNLLAMHGLLGSKSNFRFLEDPAIGGLVNGTYLLDLRNHGDSPHAPSGTFKDLAGDLKLFIESNGLRKSELGLNFP
jgi:pimeloyl-ACP methyl ester carboxylesterase